MTPDGEAREVADGLAFPNGMVVTPDNDTLIVAESFARRLTAFDIGPDGSLSNRRVWADVTGDGICLDAEGAVWTSDVGPGDDGVCLRVREGGEVLDRIELDRPCYACMLGGEDGTSLFMGGREVVRPRQDGRAHSGQHGPDFDGAGRSAARRLAVREGAWRRTR